MCSLKWTRSGINKLISFFDESIPEISNDNQLLEKFTHCKAKISQIKEQELKLNSQREALDARIKATRIEARVQAKDTRVWVKTVGGADKWAMKQNGFQ